MSATRVVCIFERPEDLVGAAAASRERGLTIVDAYAPYPVHGLSAAMGLAASRLPWVCFALGVTGGAAALLFQYWANTVSWATNVGGRPWNSFPAFVPVTFELMVLIADLGTVAAFLALAGLRPWRRADVPHARVTDDRFALVLKAASPAERASIRAVIGPFQPESIEEQAA